MIAPVALLPILAPAATAVAVLLVATARPGSRVALLVAVVGLLLGLVATPVVPHAAGLLLVVDAHTLLYTAFVTTAALALLPMVWSRLEGRGADGMLVLVLLGALGGSLLAGAAHLAVVLLGIELLSVSLYGAIAYERDGRTVAAAVRYLVQAAGASAVMAYGMAMIYADSGALGPLALVGAGPLGRAGVLLVLVGVAFKLALAPFHLWALDVYQGAPASVTALIATVSKAGVLALVVRWAAPLAGEGWLLPTLGALAALSILAGNLLALQEQSLKRLLAGSSIAHMGYALVALVAGAEEAAAIYVGAYLATALAVFGVVSLLSRPGLEADELDLYRGLLWRRPVAGALLALGLLSLAGIPLTAGFVGKLYVLLAAVDGGLWGLVVLVVVGSAVGLFYYLRVVATLFGAPAAVAGAPDAGALPVAVGWPGWAPVVAAAALVVLVGVYPMALIRLVGW